MRALLTICLCICFLNLCATGTGLKVRNTLDYQLGDTLVYKTLLCPLCNGPNQVVFYTLIAINGRTTSVAGDTIYYQTNLGSWAVTNLDSFVYKAPFQGPLLNFDSFNVYQPNLIKDSLVMDSIPDLGISAVWVEHMDDPSAFLTAQSLRYADSIGLTSQIQSDLDGVDPIINSVISLVYFKKGSKSGGTFPHSLTGIKNVTGNGNIYLKPQITQDRISVIGTSGQCDYKIYNLSGQELRSGVLDGDINVAGLAAGGYYLYISAQETQHSEMLYFVKR